MSKGRTVSIATLIKRKLVYQRLAPWLLIGPAQKPASIRALRKLGVTHVVDLRVEETDDPDEMRRLGLHWHRVPVGNGRAPTAHQFAQLWRWLDAHPEPGEVLYLHSADGLSRAPAVATALLMQQGFTLWDALEIVQAAQPDTALTPLQHDWLAERSERTGTPIAS